MNAPERLASGVDAREFEQIGRALPRREDWRLLTGTARFTDDLEVRDALVAHFLRSPHAHARILSIDFEAAKASPGVVAIVTGAELARWTSRLRMAPPIEGLLPTEVETLPTAKVRFQGDPVVCIVARDRYQAEDAAERVLIDYDPLPAVAGFEAALADNAPRVDDALTSNLVSHQRAVYGDPAAREREAFRVVTARFSQGRQTHVPIETRGCLALWDEGRAHLTFHVGTQVPHPYRTQLAARLGLSEAQVTVVSPDVGGGFGQKIALYREELTVAALARALKRPVRWREDRMENLLASAHAREQVCRTRAAVDRDGRILSLRLEIDEDFGAYCFYPANYIARVVALILTGPYRIADYAYEIRVALTNKCGSAPMRAPMAITSRVMEGTIDAVARELSLDPVEVRRVNALASDELPFTMPTGEVLVDVTPRETLEGALAAFDYADFRRRQGALRARGVWRGLGICTVVESTTYGSAFYRSAGIPGSGHEAAWVRIEPSGAVSASVGLMGTGQGYETPLAQAVAEGLGVDTATVTMRLGHTDVAPYGMGSRGARGATAGGGTLLLCAREAQAKVLAIAARMLGLPGTLGLRLREGRVQRSIDGGEWEATALTLAQIARTAYLDPLSLPSGMAPGLDFSRTWDPPPMTYSNATHLCEVEVDVPTGRVRVVRYLVAEDCGTVLNPVVVEGQQHGAVAMGLGGALMEQVYYDAEGQNLSATLADYLVPTACELPRYEIVPMHTPSSRTPGGMKGMAEGGVMGAIGAVANAVDDAIAPFGVVAEDHPLSPASLRALLRGREPRTAD